MSCAVCAMGSRLHSVQSMDLRPGADGEASIAIQASGESLGPPLLPLSADPEVALQLLNHESDGCWEATFGTLRNTDAKLSARTP